MSASGCQAFNRICLIDLMRPAGVIVPDGVARDLECLIDRCGEIFRGLQFRHGVRAVAVRGSDNLSTHDTTTSQKHGLTRSPVVSPRQAINVGGDVIDAGRSAKLASHDDQS